MKRNLTALLCGVLALSACSGDIDASGTNIQSHEHRTFSGSGIRVLRIENVAGPIVITAGKGAGIAIDATRRAGSQGAVDRTHVNYDRSGDELLVKTTYDRSPGFFANNSGGTVAYNINVPSSVDLDITNVSGPIDVKGTAGDIRANEVSGPITVNAGRIGSNRRVRLSAVSGRIQLTIARNSDLTLDAGSVSGNIDAFFPADEHRGMVGSSLKGRLGSGAGSLSLSTVSGRISIVPQ